ncbi:AAA family ATPase [Hafnia alvei]|uniref:AAA family ATPase n=1 Tax=Hafnia alvei TaxID=569 RepID=UPI0040455BCC
MTIKLHTLAVTGPGKEPALLELDGQSHLIFGPTDSGKSYIVECIRYCLGSSQRPKDIGFSEGYTKIALQIVLPDNKPFTLFRDLTGNGEAVYSGFHITQPIHHSAPPSVGISELLPSWCNGAGKKILIKSGVVGNFTAGDLRKFSIFDEIETLDNVPLEGSDTNLKTRNKSSLALILTGTDDSDIILPPSTEQRHIAKGHAEALEDHISELLAEIPTEITKKDAEEALEKISTKIENINQYLYDHIEELSVLKEKRANLEHNHQSLTRQLFALHEAQERFNLLDHKYKNDLSRLQTMGTAAAVVSHFDIKSCPLCFTKLKHQDRHANLDGHVPLLQQAAKAEGEKIQILRNGLKVAIEDLSGDIQELTKEIGQCNAQIKDNIYQQDAILMPRIPSLHNGLLVMTERKTELTMIMNNLARVDELRIRVAQMKNKSKRKKQVIQRDMAQSSTNLCHRIKTLLDLWHVPGVSTVHFNETTSDIEVNQRQRTSYGKGKRGIFLTAYMIALMENAVANQFPHLGVVVVDSPVVTYKDPKHAATTDSDELLDEGVKDHFYSWLADKKTYGQVIILENEDPNESQKLKLNFTEFVGPENKLGRAGFFPTKIN